jgi:hypothetical protein
MGALFQNRLADWPSVVTQLWLWRSREVSVENQTVKRAQKGWCEMAASLEVSQLRAEFFKGGWKEIVLYFCWQWDDREFCKGRCEDRTWATEAEESPLSEVAAGERLVRTQQAEKRLAGAEVICKVGREDQEAGVKWPLAWDLSVVSWELNFETPACQDISLGANELRHQNYWV